MKEFMLQELSEFDGKDGKPAYVSHEGKVYDVSDSKLWRGGMHMRRHQSGTDLTPDIQAAPHESDVLSKFPQVGTLIKEKPSEVNLPTPVAVLLDRNPFFRRHPHPMTVHFPIVFFLFNPFFNILYVLTGNSNFESTAFHCLVLGILTALVAIVTGLVTWWYNYMGKMATPITIKISLSILLIFISLVALLWRVIDPAVMTDPLGLNPAYLFLVILFVPIISVIGWFGASLTFPIEKE